MSRSERTLDRRSFVTSLATGAALLAGKTCWGEAGPGRSLSAEHRQAVDRRRRIVVQYDAQGLWDLDFATWLDYRFRYVDEPGTQIDGLWWDMGRLGQVLYPSAFLDSLSYPGLDKWRQAGIDMVGRVVEESRKRHLEVFWHHRVSEVDIAPDGRGAAWKGEPAPLKKAHPDWVLKTDWWPHGLWNFAVPEVRDCTVKCLQEVVRKYDFDGVQLDFARHIPCLPVGRQWELRHHVTELVRSTRRMLLDEASRRGKPLLLAAKVPQTLDGCRADGFDVAQWAREELVDIFTLGSRSMEVDVAAFRSLVAGRHIKLQPCFDDHHTTDGYRSPPIEVFRGVFGNWWQQGADSVATFNWSNASPELTERLGGEVGPLSQRVAYHEVGSPETLRLKDKTYPVERRGGYPWAQGFFNRNDTAPLPMPLERGGAAGSVRVRVGDDVQGAGQRLRAVVLRLVFFDAADSEQIEARFNGHALTLRLRDPAWKDPQIFSPRPQPASGGNGVYRVNPRQRLLRLEFAIDPKFCRQGENQLEIAVKKPEDGKPGKIVLEKVEIDVRYAASAKPSAGK